MQICDIKPVEGSTHRNKKVGRGPGSGHGKTSGRGHKGNKARGQVNPNFEGGQTPLHRRLPQLRGFKSVNRKSYAVVNVSDLNTFENGTEITAELLAECGLIRGAEEGLKILADGDMTKKLIVKAHKFSAKAAEKIAAAGGEAITL